MIENRYIITILKIYAIGAFFLGCFTNEPIPKRSDVKTVKRSGDGPARPPTPIPTPLLKKPTVAIAKSAGECKPLGEKYGKGSFFVAEHNFFVTHLASVCTTSDGHEGFEADTAWTAMGIPCTGGGGKIDWIDKYVSPKLVTFSMATNCPMDPAEPGTVQLLGTQMLGLSNKSKLLAYTPFVVQYWEAATTQEADVGSNIEIRNLHDLQSTWAKVREGQLFEVTLVGRENAWVQGDRLYEVRGNIQVTARNRFRYLVLSAHVLEGDDKATVKARCEQLRPKRNCSEVFGR